MDVLVDMYGTCPMRYINLFDQILMSAPQVPQLVPQLYPKQSVSFGIDKLVILYL